MSVPQVVAAASAIPRRPAAGPQTFTNRMKDHIRNFAVFVRRENRKGAASNYYVAGVFIACSIASYKIGTQYVIPWRRMREKNGVPILKVPLQEEHNKEYGIQSRHPLREFRENESWSPDTVLNQPKFERPTIAGKERSELAEEPSNWTVLQLREFDKTLEQDVFVRTLHLFRAPEVDPQTVSSNEVRKRLESKSMLAQYGESIIHSTVKCRAVSPTNNCIPDTALMSEVVRKQLTALAPMFMLRHPADHILPMRWSKHIEPANYDLLFLGLGGGGMLANFLNRAFPHYKLDVVEPDGGLVRACRKYLGFKERDGLNLVIDSPVAFLRRNVASKKRYHAVFVDLVDEKGNIPTAMCKMEPLSNIKTLLSDCGVAVLNLPNHDEKRLATVVQNWRMAFDTQAVLLLHCATSPNSILMTFMDTGDRGFPKMGYVATVEDFRELIRNVMHNFEGRFNFDILGEVHERNFQQLLPGRKYKFKKPSHPGSMDADQSSSK